MLKTPKIITSRDPKSPISEVYRTLRTNIKFASLDRDIKTILFTSTGPGEGKSTTVANLAVTLQESGSKVILVEGDLRNPTVHRMFGLKNVYGLTNILVDKGSYKDFIQPSMIEDLDILTCGPKPPNPSEILGSSRMKKVLEELRNDYDYVLVDAPPIVVVTDAALLASMCDGTILVIASGEAIIEGAIKAKELLVNVKANIIGTVLNKCKDSHVNHYYSSYYYGKKNKKMRSIL